MDSINIIICFLVGFVLLIIAIIWIGQGTKCNGLPHIPFPDDEPPKRRNIMNKTRRVNIRKASNNKKFYKLELINIQVYNEDGTESHTINITIPKCNIGKNGKLLNVNVICEE